MNEPSVSGACKFVYYGRAETPSSLASRDERLKNAKQQEGRSKYVVAGTWNVAYGHTFREKTLNIY